MKVLVVSGLYYPNVYGGTERIAQRLAEGLLARGHEAAVATLNPGRSYEIAKVNGVVVHYLPVRLPYFPGKPEARSVAAKLLWHSLDTYNYPAASALGKVIDKERPDVVNTHNIGGFSPAAWDVVKRRRVPLVNTTHGLNLLCPWFMLRGNRACKSQCGRCRLYALPRKFFSRRVDVLTGVSEFLIDKYTEHKFFPSAQKMVIYNTSGTKGRDIARPDVDHYPMCFGFLGRLHPSKGVGLLIEAFLSLPQGTAKLAVAGEGVPEYEREIKQRANGSHDVEWLGVATPDALFRRARVLVVPSMVHDSAPLTVLEGLAHGVPVIGSRRGGIPELMGDGTGWTFDPDEPGGLACAMRRAIESRGELAAMGERAIQRARSFTTESMVDGYLRAYESAIEKSGRTDKGR